MSLVLALLSSVVLGSADFVGGLAARRALAGVVVIWSNAVGLAMALVVVLLLPAHLSAADLGWGLLAGTCGSLGAVLLYRALAVAAMSVVAPTAAAAAAVIPVLAGLLMGERLSPAGGAGITAALVAVVLTSRTAADRHWRPHVRRGAGYALLAGVAFGVFLVVLARASAASGLWPLVAARTASLTVLLGLALGRGLSLRPTGTATRLSALAGVLDMTANVLFLVAIQAGTLAVVGLLASLSPLGTVLLAGIVLKERLRPVQGTGIVLAMTSVLLLALR
jgi:drug/metabolite transporter (DMT)-like permease